MSKFTSKEKKDLDSFYEITYVYISPRQNSDLIELKLKTHKQIVRLSEEEYGEIKYNLEICRFYPRYLTQVESIQLHESIVMYDTDDVKSAMKLDTMIIDIEKLN